LRAEGALPAPREILPVPLLWRLPDSIERVRFLGKEDAGHAGTETGQRIMKLFNDFMGLMYCLLDVLAYRLVFR
jgi:hypothetical protein